MLVNCTSYLQDSFVRANPEIDYVTPSYIRLSGKKSSRQLEFRECGVESLCLLPFFKVIKCYLCFVAAGEGQLLGGNCLSDNYSTGFRITWVKARNCNIVKIRPSFSSSWSEQFLNGRLYKTAHTGGMGVTDTFQLFWIPSFSRIITQEWLVWLRLKPPTHRSMSLFLLLLSFLHLCSLWPPSEISKGWLTDIAVIGVSTISFDNNTTRLNLSYHNC